MEFDFSFISKFVKENILSVTRDTLNYSSELAAFGFRLCYGFLLVKIYSDVGDYWMYVAFTGLTAFLAYGDLGFVSIAIKFFNNDGQKKSLQNFFLATYLGLLVALSLAIAALLIYLNPSLYYSSGTAISNFDLSALTLFLICQSFVLVFKRIFEGILRAELNMLRYNLINCLFFLIMSVYFIFVTMDYISESVVQMIGIQTFCYLVAAGLLLENVWRKYRFELFQIFQVDMYTFRKVFNMNAYAIIVTLSWLIYSELDRVILTKMGDIEGLSQLGILLFFVGLARPIFGLLSRQIPIKLNIVYQEDKSSLGQFVNSVVASNVFWLTIVLCLLFEWGELFLHLVTDIEIPYKLVFLLLLGLLPNIYSSLYTGTIEAHSLARLGSFIALTKTILFVVLILTLGVTLTNILAVRAILSIISLFVYVAVVKYYNGTSGLTQMRVFVFVIIGLKSLLICYVSIYNLLLGIFLSSMFIVSLVIYNRKNLRLL